MSQDTEPSVLKRWITRWDFRGLLVPVLLLLLWQYMSGRDASHAYAFVPLQQVWSSLKTLLASGELWVNLLGSLHRTTVGLLLGIVLGLLVGALMAISKIANTLIGPLYHSIRQVPILGLTPLIGLWMGNGEPAKVFIITLAAFFPVVLNTYEGLRQVDVQHAELAQVYQFNRRQYFWRMRLPAAIPSILTGFLHAVTFAWITAIGSELLFNAGAGLGNLMMTAEVGAHMDIILICAITVTILGVLMTQVVQMLSRRLLRWRPPLSYASRHSK